MSESPAARRLVTPADIIDLADFLTASSVPMIQSPLRPKPPSDYEAGVARLFEACVKPYYSGVTFNQFRGHVRWRCREYLALQARKA